MEKKAGHSGDVLLEVSKLTPMDSAKEICPAGGYQGIQKDFSRVSWRQSVDERLNYKNAVSTF